MEAILASQEQQLLIAENQFTMAKLSLAQLLLVKDYENFEIAEEDLNLRGPGEFLGQRQSGLPEFILADLAAHHDLLVKISDCDRQFEFF